MQLIFLSQQVHGVGQVVITASLRRIAKPGETEDNEDSDQFKLSHELLVSVADSGKEKVRCDYSVQRQSVIVPNQLTLLTFFCH